MTRAPDDVHPDPRRPRSDRVTDGDEWMTMHQVTEYLGRTERSVRHMVTDGRLNAYKLGPHYRFRRQDIEALFRPVTFDEPA